MGERQITVDPVAEMGRVLLERLRPYPCFGGLDLAAVADLTAFVLAWPIGEYVYVYPWFWIPADDLEARSKRDNVTYSLWVEQGFIETTPGNMTDWRFVTARIQQLARTFKIRKIGFDRNGARDTAADLAESGLEMADIHQNFGGMGPPSKRLEELVISRRLVHSGHPVLRWNIDCCSVISDAAGLIRPDKPNRHRDNKRIDGVEAMIMAIDCAMREPMRGPSVYATRGLLSV